MDETMQRAAADEARHYAEMEAEAHRAAQEEYHGQQALDHAIGTFGVPEVLRRIAKHMNVQATPDPPELDDEVF